tara:strand:- start:539 stop:865 length:327 start_codon:yes stop_codon:yes gene_type:complete
MKSFLIYKHLEPIVDQLPDKEAGKLFKALFEYERTQTIPKLTEITNLAFTMFKLHLDKGRQDYEKRCETNRNNAKRKKAIVTDGKQSQTKRANINKNININKEWKDVG